MTLPDFTIELELGDVIRHVSKDYYFSDETYKHTVWLAVQCSIAQGQPVVIRGGRLPQPVRIHATQLPKEAS